MNKNLTLTLITLTTFAVCACTTVAGNPGTTVWQSSDTQSPDVVFHIDAGSQSDGDNDTTPALDDQVVQPATCGLGPDINGKYNVIDVAYPEPSMQVKLVYHDDGTCAVDVYETESGEGPGYWPEDMLKFKNPILELFHKDGSLMVRMEKAAVQP